MKRQINRSLLSCLLILIAFLFSSTNLTAQLITTYAGGRGIDGQIPLNISLSGFDNLKSDKQGNIYFIYKRAFIKRISKVKGTIEHVGGKLEGSAAENIPALSAAISPRKFDIDRYGNIVIAEPTRIRVIDAATGTINTIAGNGTAGNLGDGQQAINAWIYYPNGIALDTAGNIYFSMQHRVRKIDRQTGIISTIAGSDMPGKTGDDGPAVFASLESPRNILVDTAGNILINDYANQTIRKIHAATGIITLYAGGGTADTPTDIPVTAVSYKLNQVMGMDLDENGNLFLSQQGLVKMITAATGIIETVAGIRYQYGNSGDGGSPLQATFGSIYEIVCDVSGGLLIGDVTNDRIRKIDSSFTRVNAFAGNGHQGIGGFGFNPANIQLESNTIIALSKGGELFTAPSHSPYIYKYSHYTKGFSVFAGSWYGFEGDGDFARNTHINGVLAMAADSRGNLYFTDNNGSCVRMIDSATWRVTTVAGSRFFPGFSGNGGPAINAVFGEISGISFDTADNMYLTDRTNHVVWKVDAATKIINIIAGTGLGGYTGDGGTATSAKLFWPVAVATDKEGNVFVADNKNNVVRKITASSGIISTVAGNGTPGISGDGGDPTQASLLSPVALAVSDEGHIYISTANRIRKVNPFINTIITFAGSGSAVYNGENLDPIAAGLSPAGLAIDRDRQLYVADAGNDRIRKVVPHALLSGNVFYDMNRNGIKDADEKPADGITVSAFKQGFSLSSNVSNGRFELAVDTGTYTTNVTLPPSYQAIPDKKISVINMTVRYDTVDFALQPISGNHDLEVAVTPYTVARPGFDMIYKVSYQNAGADSIDNVKLQVILSKKLEMTDGTKDTILINLGRLHARSKGAVYIVGKLLPPPGVNIGEYLICKASISSDSIDIAPGNNFTENKLLITGSYDPNDKSEAHAGTYTLEQAANRDFLEYLIRFQNTGTDTAFTVRIQDQLDSLLDASSLEMIGSSHPYKMKLLNGNQLIWQFDNILLPDSNINEPASHGYVTFRIRPRTVLKAGQQVVNSSSIYFDYNLPVVTNLVVTTVRPLPSLPPAPLLAPTSMAYCMEQGDTTLQLTNLPAVHSGIAVMVKLDSTIIPVRPDSTFKISPVTAGAGQHRLTVLYSNEAGEQSAHFDISVSEVVSPGFRLTTSATQVNAATDQVTIAAIALTGSGTTPQFAYSLNRSFTNLLQPEAVDSTIVITAQQLSDGENWIYVRMISTASCITAPVFTDSIRVEKKLLTTGVIDVNNPGVPIVGYPNPFASEITLKGLQPAKIYRVRAVNTMGQELFSRVIKHAATFSFQTGNWKSGLYYLFIYEGQSAREIGAIKMIRQ